MLGKVGGDRLSFAKSTTTPGRRQSTTTTRARSSSERGEGKRTANAPTPPTPPAGNGKRTAATRAISDPSSQTPSSSPPDDEDFEDEKTTEMLDQRCELNGDNFAEQTVATPSDGPIDVLHASSKQTKSWQAVRRAVTTGPVQSNALIGGTPDWRTNV